MKIQRPHRSRRPTPDVTQRPGTGLAVGGGPVGAARDPQSFTAALRLRRLVSSRLVRVLHDVAAGEEVVDEVPEDQPRRSRVGVSGDDDVGPVRPWRVRQRP